MRSDLVTGAAHPPLSHHGLAALSAPTQVWSAQDGSMAGGADGVFHGDWRFASAIVLLVDGLPVEPMATAEEPDWIVFRGLAIDPLTSRPRDRVAVERMREVYSGGTVERVTLVNGGEEAIDLSVELSCEVGFAPLSSVQAGRPQPADVRLELEGDEAIATDGIRTLRASSRGGHVRIEGNRIVVSQQARVVPDDWAGVTLEIELVDPTLVLHGTDSPEMSAELRPTGRPALDRWSTRAIADLQNLLLDAGHGAFPAAGAPWHMTMVARDALIACRLLLPLGGQLAEGTLRTLAARQGVQLDPATGEEPGRILHEMRQAASDPPRPGVEARPVYRGSIDPTPLWIVLLHDAWRNGLPLETVRELRTALHAALGWMQAHSDDDLLRCADETGMGVAGKDWRADRLGRTDRDIAAAQVQGLACRAAVGAAALLDALGDDGAPWRAWAERLRARFREEFWVELDGTRFPAMAVDGADHPIPILVSDIGQLIGTTLLDRDEEAAVAQLLLDDRLSSGFGLRTMATDAEQYWPLSHYCGAVWPHDTAIAIEGLLRAGLLDEARQLAIQLERAADAFDGRMPEVYAGYGLEDTAKPIPYPGACSPQAWSAASVVPVRIALASRDDAQLQRPLERRLVAVVPPSAPSPAPHVVSAPEAMQINGGAKQHARARLRLVPSIAPKP
ncbi:glycogen debranching N-terminal domain-containing protein [Agrococcus sp. ARC_14]|uniref:glycogen debranching N-terminal domain-containing protein n=1 Tax=Agrococcus sp. ARC_14 TaxID=2919927 RepID=UPI001F0685A6|nr:glycogen debranching N-terminal domain-containing protein [Agrococcus sp. ARC_14]MCH1881673.1 amylo-alpha-1,6-glucosidase [Agrococcus sp. ARC_14]